MCVCVCVCVYNGSSTLNHTCTGKGHPRTGHEGPKGEYMYSSTLSLTSKLDGVGGQRQAPAALPPEKTRYPLYRRLGEPPSPYMYSGIQKVCYKYCNYSIKYIVTNFYVTLYVYVLIYCCHYTYTGCFRRNSKYFRRW